MDTKRIVITLLASLAAVLLVLWAVSAMSAWLIGPLPGGGEESSEPTVAPAEPTPTPPPAVEPTPAPVPSVPVTPAAVTPAPVPTSKYVVCIDPGHQLHADSGQEPIGPGASETRPKVAGGATGVATHNPESEINLAVGLKLRGLLQARGVRVFMTRTTQDVNVANSLRAKIANNAHADLFVRLHCDGIGDSSAHGVSTLVPAKNTWTGDVYAESGRAGRIVQPKVVAATGASDRGVVERSDLTGFNWCDVPAVLVEMGFMSNASEDRKLATSAYQTKLAEGIRDGVMAYLESR